MNQPFNLNRGQEPELKYIIGVDPYHEDGSPLGDVHIWENSLGTDIGNKLGIAANLASGKYNKDENNNS